MGEVHYMTQNIEDATSSNVFDLRPSLPLINKPTGARPSIEWVLLADLKVDDTYQRDVDNGPSRRLIKLMAANWDWRMCLPLLVSRRDDGLYVIDGQHRRESAQRRGDIDQLPCMISRYTDTAEEAEMFVRMNRSRRQMNRLDDFHAAQISGDPESIAVAKIITDAGFTVARKTGSQSWVPGAVAFTTAVARERRKHGDDVCYRALKMMADGFPGQVLTAGSSMFVAIVRILTQPPAGFDAELFACVLRGENMVHWSSFLTQTKASTDRMAALKQVLLMSYEDAAREALTA